jgi:hypothetical protein
VKNWCSKFDYFINYLFNAQFYSRNHQSNIYLQNFSCKLFKSKSVSRELHNCWGHKTDAFVTSSRSHSVEVWPNFSVYTFTKRNHLTWGTCSTFPGLQSRTFFFLLQRQALCKFELRYETSNTLIVNEISLT